MSQFKFVSPEEVGYSTNKLQEFIDDLNNKNYRIHTFLMSRKDHIFLNINNGLYNESSIHRMYSQTKSFVGLAIGLLYDDKLIKLEDKLSSYFPEYITPYTDEVLLNQTIEDTLKMTTCVEYKNWFQSKEKDRVKLYFSLKHNRKCQERFEYDSAGSMVLCALVEKLTHKTLFKFLYERILKYLHYFDNAYTLMLPDGRTWGDSAMMCSTLAMLSLGRFVLDKGIVRGKRLLSEEYINMATSFKISTENENARYKRYGYGYQIWLCNGGYAFLGMGNQITIMYPKYDVVVAITGDSFDKIPESRDYIFDNMYEIISHPKTESEIKGTPLMAKLDIFKNVAINKTIIKKYFDKCYINMSSFINSFKMNYTDDTLTLSLMVENKEYLLKIKDNKTTKTTIKDIYSQERLVNLPPYSTYDLYVGVEKCSENSILLQGQIIGEYLAIIKLEIEFISDKKAKLTLRSFAENFILKYNIEEIYDID